MPINFHPIQTIKNAVASVVAAVVSVITFFAAALTEPDGNGGKASWSRIAATYVVYRVIETEVITGKVLDAGMTMFWVLVGYGMVSKVLNSASPAVLDFFKSKLVLAGVQVNNSKVPPTSGA